MLYLVLLWWFEQWEFRSNCENYFCSTGIFFRSGSFCRRKCFLPQEVLFLVLMAEGEGGSVLVNNFKVIQHRSIAYLHYYLLIVSVRQI